MKTLVNRQESSLGKFATPINSERQLMFGARKGITVDECIRGGLLDYIGWCLDNVKGFELTESEQERYYNALDNWADSYAYSYGGHYIPPPDPVINVETRSGMGGTYQLITYRSGKTEEQPIYDEDGYDDRWAVNTG